MDAPAAKAWRARWGDRTATRSLRCAAFSAAPPSCHFTAAPRWWPFSGLTCSLALRGHNPLRKPPSHACSRGQGWVSMALEPKRSSCPCLLTHGYTPPRRLAHRSRYPGAQDGVRDFSTRDLRPGPRAIASFRPKRLPLARAPRPSAAPFAARCAPSDCSQQRSTLPASSLTCTRDPCALSRACLCGQGAPSTCRTSTCSVAPALAVDKGHGEAARARSGSPLGCARGGMGHGGNDGRGRGRGRGRGGGGGGASKITARAACCDLAAGVAAVAPGASACGATPARTRPHGTRAYPGAAACERASCARLVSARMSLLRFS